MTKLRAFLIHLAISTVIVAVFLGIMFFIWYPSPYFEVDGGWTVLRVLIGVDLVLGPLLTLIVFKPGKRTLKFDMTCIALLQLAALIYGSYVIYQQRPVFVVFAVDRFNTVPASEVDYSKLQYPELNQILDLGPTIAQARIPEDPKQRQELMFNVMETGRDIELRPEFYHPYKPDIAKELLPRSINIKHLSTLSAENKQELDQFMNQHEGNLDDYLYFPLVGKNKSIVMALSRQTGLPVGTMSIDPWLQE